MYTENLKDWFSEEDFNLFVNFINANSITKKAFEFAFEKHKLQKRKFNNEPYINHPVRIAINAIKLKIENLVYTVTVILLHDTVEDTDTTSKELEALFGYSVALSVESLTEIKDDTKTKKEKNQLYNDQLKDSSMEVQNAKGLDINDNIKDITEQPDLRYARKYLNQKWEQLNYLDEMSPDVKDFVLTTLKNAENELTSRKF